MIEPSTTIKKNRDRWKVRGRVKPLISGQFAQMVVLSHKRVRGAVPHKVHVRVLVSQRAAAPPSCLHTSCVVNRLLEHDQRVLRKAGHRGRHPSRSKRVDASGRASVGEDGHRILEARLVIPARRQGETAATVHAARPPVPRKAARPLYEGQEEPLPVLFR